ncbi:unnamed protein product [Clonostachys chloroleuca]|uniref:Uncharacterized protein n=1 Tax=Clonostachys chloroleuca TaxID=1926264 RepID=A0AA35Q8B4_9HYPO|nr:unnamed protein product [Clonostachys chloroleuca]
MSAVAMPFDPTMTLGPRQAFTWPGKTAFEAFSWAPEGANTPPAGPLESAPSHHDSILEADFTSMHSASDPSLTPPSIASSITSSPPRTAYTTEHREMKRQQDRVRRDSRLVSRLRRVSSQPSYLESPPLSIADVTSSMELPTAYTSAAAPMSLLTEPAGPLTTQSYLPPYSPPLPEAAQASPMFPSPYAQSLPQQSYGMPLEYQPSPYASPSHYSRSPSLSVGHQDAMMYQVPAVMATGGAPIASALPSASASPEGGHVRVVQSRPKPRCWEHGCNGRQFSTFSNLLRHQREKSGQAAKASCPNCGAEFTRTTARNGHLLHDKCKQRRNS